MRLRLDRLRSEPDPVASFAEALTRLAQWGSERETDEPISPLCETILLTHGRRTERAVVMLHGFTNCPQQFRLLGEQFHERGYNVLIPRFPLHGLANRDNDTFVKLKAEQLAVCGNTAVDIAVGLGEHVTVLGISGGGALTAWLAYERPEVETAALISPLFGVGPVPMPATRPVTRFLLATPNRFLDWDDEEEAAEPVEDKGYGYPRFATRPLAEFLRLGEAVKRMARERAPHARTLAVITNENDASVNNAATDRLVRRWRGSGLLKRGDDSRVPDLKVYVFSKSVELPHDVIDPGNPEQNVALVYPVIHKLLE